MSEDHAWLPLAKAMSVDTRVAMLETLDECEDWIKEFGGDEDAGAQALSAQIKGLMFDAAMEAIAEGGKHE